MRGLLLFLSFLFVLGSCRQDYGENINDELHIAIKRDPIKLNPIIYFTQRSRVVSEYIFTPVGDFHPDSHELIPIIIEKIPEPEFIKEGDNAGKIKYEIDIVDDATWEDGRPITGADYVFTLKTIKHPETSAASFRSYLTDLVDAKVDPNDPNKVHILFNEYYMLSTAAISTMYIYPKHIYDPTSALDSLPLAIFEDEDKFSSAVKKDSSIIQFAKTFNSIKYSREVVSGSGPYKLVDWVSDQIVILERKENYWGKGKNIPQLNSGPKKLIFHILPEEQTVINQMKNGTVDLYSGASAKMYREFEDSTSNYTVMAPEVMRSYYILLNNNKPELSDKDSRRALAHLVNVPELIELLEGGLATPATGVINPNKKIHNSNIKPIAFDISRAQELLKTDGWQDSNNDGTIDKSINGKHTEFELDMYTTGSELSNKIALLFSQNADQVGIKINIKQKKFSLFKRENLATLDYDLFTSAINQSLANDDPYSKWHIDNAHIGGTNQSAYSSLEASSLIDNIRETKDETERVNLYKKFQDVIYEDQPVIWLYHPRERMILSNKWKGTSTIKRPGYLANTFTIAK